MLAKIGFPACRKLIGNHYYHCVGEKYINAVVDVVQALPVLIPAISQKVAHEEFLEGIDGLVLTGSYSNVQSTLYGESLAFQGGESDPARDHLTMDLIRQAVARGMPVLGICRGIQEINVALGGSLHQQVHATGEHDDHREDQNDSLDQQYDLSHPIAIQPGGILSRLWPDSEVQVNSLHGQGIKQLAPDLRVEAIAPDGLIEAVSLDKQPLLGVQWHPEWKVSENNFYQQIFLWLKSQAEIYRNNRG